MSQPEPAADEPAVAENPPDFFRRGVRGDIKIFRVAAEQQVAYAAAGEIGEIAGVFEAVEDFECGSADLFAADGVIGAGYNLRFHTITMFPRFRKM